MAPPSFADLGKSCRDLFTRGYNFGCNKLEIELREPTPLKVKTNCTINHDTGKFDADIESQAYCKALGANFKEKITSDNNLETTLTLDDERLRGLMMEFRTALAMTTSKKSGAIKAAYKRDCLHFTSDVDFAYAGPTVTAGLVVKHCHMMAGIQGQYDKAKAKFTKNTIGFVYSREAKASAPAFMATVLVADASDFSCSLFNQVTDSLQFGVQFNWHNVDSPAAPRLGVAARYDVDENTSLHAKVNNESLLALGVTQKLREGLSLIASSQINMKDFDAGGHKVGIGFKFES